MSHPVILRVQRDLLGPAAANHIVYAPHMLMIPFICWCWS